MYATLTAAALTLAAAQPPNTAPGTNQPDRSGSTPGVGGAAGPQASIDGTWHIVVLEKNGRPVTDAKNMTVSIRGNVVTFNKAGSAGAGGTTTPGTQPGAGGTQPGGSALGGSSDMRSMRVEFGPNGTVRVMEADATGKFGEHASGTGAATGTTPRPGTGTTPGTGTGTTPGAGTPGSSAGLGSQSGMRTGVYVLTQDYLAVCVHDTGTGIGQPGTTSLDRPGTTGTTRPGTTGTDRPGAGNDRPGTGTDRPGADRPGSDRPGAGQDRPGTGDRPGAGGTSGPSATGTRPGGASGIGDGRLPAQRSYVTVILRRDTGSRPAAAAAAR